VTVIAKGQNSLMGSIAEWVEHPVESKRCDWFTGTFVLHTGEHEDNLIGLAHELAALSDPRSAPQPLRTGRHFTHVRQYDTSGVVLQYTPRVGLDGSPVDKKNAGLASLTLSGRFWGSLSAPDRGAVSDTLRTWDGFKQATRLDFQMTVLNPEVGASELVALVEEGLVWPKGFGQGYAYGRRNLHGEFTQTPSYYFGGKESRVTARCYDKAVESDWDVPAVRHELTLRDAPADQWFRRLSAVAKTELHQPPLLHRGEELTVSAALDQHLDYRDTSRWAGGRKPKNWAQSAKRLQWWDQMLAEKGDPLAISYFRENTLDQSVDRMIEQYGRKFALWVLHRAGEDGEAVTNLLIHTFSRCVARTKDEDVSALLEEMQPEDRQRVQRWLRKLQREASVIAERMEPPQGGKSDPSL
jgi:hypothetical protein